MRLIRNRWNNQLEHTLKSVDRQEKGLLGDFTPIADFRLKCCIKEQKSKKKITGRSPRGQDIRSELIFRTGYLFRTSTISIELKSHLFSIFFRTHSSSRISSTCSPAVDLPISLPVNVTLAIPFSGKTI